MSTLTDAATNILTLQATSVAAQRLPAWENVTSYLVTAVQIVAIAADPDAQSWLVDNRSFLKNNGVAPVVIHYNGQAFTFTNGVAYTAHPEEINFFLSQASFLGATFARVTLATWLADNAGTSFYFQ